MLIQDLQEWVPANGMLTRGDYAKIEYGGHEHVGTVRLAINMGDVDSPDWRMILETVTGHRITYVQHNVGGSVTVPKLKELA
jgi:hypothetical protein